MRFSIVTLAPAMAAPVGSRIEPSIEPPDCATALGGAAKKKAQLAAIICSAAQNFHALSKTGSLAGIVNSPFRSGGIDNESSAGSMPQAMAQLHRFGGSDYAGGARGGFGRAAASRIGLSSLLSMRHSTRWAAWTWVLTYGSSVGMWPLRHSAHVRSSKEPWEWAGRKTALETTRNASVASNASHDFHEGRRYAAIQRLRSVGQWTPERRRRFPKKIGFRNQRIAPGKKRHAVLVRRRKVGGACPQGEAEPLPAPSAQSACGD